MDYSTTLSPRSGSARLSEILRQILIMEGFNVEPLPEGGFRAWRRSTPDKKYALQMVSRVTVTPMGREVVVEAQFGGARWMRNFLVLIFMIMAVAMFVAMSLDPKVAHSPQRFMPFAIFTPIILLIIFIFPLMRRQATQAMERLVKAAVNISEIP